VNKLTAERHYAEYLIQKKRTEIEYWRTGDENTTKRGNESKT
jgi:hypothetical protein